MRAYKCEICGKLYETNADLLIGQTKKERIKCVLGYKDKEDFNSRVDVCPDCIEAIQRVINERNNQNVH